MPQQRPYPEIIQEFIESIESLKDAADNYFEKCTMGHLVWNYCVSLHYELYVFQDLFEVINHKYLQEEHTRKKVEMLMEKWLENYSWCNRIIMRIERRYSKDIPAIHVETVSAEVFRSKRNP
jgi:hypothetical protein